MKHYQTIAHLFQAFTLTVLVLAVRHGRAEVSTRFTVPNGPDVTAIDAYIEGRMRELRIPGLAVGIVQGDRIVHLKGFGIADPSERPVTPRTPFVLGSVSKSLTALAIMQLVAAGKVELDAPVRRYLPWFRLADAQASALITVRHLLTHTGGLPRSADGQTVYVRDTGEGALERQIRGLASVPAPRPAGTAYEYTNADFNILGLVVEAVSGQPFGDYLQARVFTPLGMQHSATRPEAAHDLAMGYRYWFGRPVPARMPAAPANLPSGFIIASAEDMTHVLVAHLNGGRYAGETVLSATSIDTLQQPFATGVGTLQAGIAWDVIETRNGVRMLAKDGATANYHARLVLLPGGKWGVIVLANAFENGSMARFNTLADGVAALLLGRSPVPVLPANTLDPMRWALAAAVVLSLIAALRSVRSARRSTTARLARPAAGRAFARSPWWSLTGHVLLALAILASPRLMGMTLVPFLYDYSPDIFWLLVALAGIPLSAYLVTVGPSLAQQTTARLEFHREEPKRCQHVKPRSDGRTAG